MRLLLLLLLATRASLDIPLDMISEATNVTLGAGLNILMILIGLWAMLKKHGSASNGIALSWLPLFACLTFSLLRTPVLADGLRLWASLLTFPSMMVAACALVEREDNFFTLVKTVIFSVFIPAATAFAQLALYGASDDRIKGTFAHPNIYAFYLLVVIAALFCVPALQKETKLSATFKRLSFMGVMALLLIATQTRSAWAALLAMLAILSVTVNRKMLLALFLLPALLFVPAVQTRIADVVDAPKQTVTLDDVARGYIVVDSYTWRKLLWAEAIEDSKENRIFGKGIAAFSFHSPRFFPIDPHAQPHSAYIQTLYEIGVPGMLAYILSVLYPLIVIVRNRKFNPGASYTVIALIVASALAAYSDNTLYYLSYNWYLTALIGGYLGYLRNRKNGPLLTPRKPLIKNTAGALSPPEESIADPQIERYNLLSGSVGTAQHAGGTAQ